MKRIAIVGAGGMARDALHVLDALGLGARISGFHESAAVWQARDLLGLPVLPLDRIDAGSDVLIAIGNGAARAAMVEAMPVEVDYPVFVHPSVSIGRAVELGEGTLVCAGSILTVNIRVGRHVQLNLGSFLAHDGAHGDFVTTGPGARINGHCTIGARAYIGSNACLRERTTVAADAVIGMGAVVVCDVPGGTWVGNPARRLR